MVEGDVNQAKKSFMGMPVSSSCSIRYNNIALSALVYINAIQGLIIELSVLMTLCPGLMQFIVAARATHFMNTTIRALADIVAILGVCCGLFEYVSVQIAPK